MRMRAKIDKRRQESSMDVNLDQASRRRRRSALDINKIKMIEHDAVDSLVISQTDLAEKNRLWMRQTPIQKFKLLQKRVILIIRCYGILKSYAYDGRAADVEEPQEERSALRDKFGKIPAHSLKKTVKKVIQFMSANNKLGNSVSLKNSYGTDAAFTMHNRIPKFNPEFFSAGRALRFPQKCRAICQKRPIDRTPDDIRTLRACIHTLSSFRKFSPELQECLAKVMRFERYDRRRVVVRRGHVGTSMYFIFFGLVGVTTDFDGSSLFVTNDPILLNRGKAFGEMALLQGGRRNATVCCMEMSEFLVVDKEDFYSLKMDVFLVKEFSSRFSFFNDIDVFQKISANQVTHLASKSKSELYSINSIIQHDTRQSSSVHFIQHGIVDVLRCVSLHDCPSYHKMLYLSFGDQNKNRHSRIPQKDTPYQKSGHLKFNFYARVRRLYSGEYFYHLPDEKREFILVSRGSTIIRIQRESMVEMGVMKSILSETKHFPTDDQISATFMIQNEWRYFKKVVIDAEAVKIAKKSARMGSLVQSPAQIAVNVGLKHNNYSFYFDTEGCKMLPIKNSSKVDFEKVRLIHNIKLPLYLSKEFYNQALPMIDAYYE